MLLRKIAEALFNGDIRPWVLYAALVSLSEEGCSCNGKSAVTAHPTDTWAGRTDYWIHI